MSVNPRPAIVESQTIIRPANTDAYASGDLVANHGTAASVTPFKFTSASRINGYKSRLVRVGLFTSQALLANGTFRVHLFSALPTVANGDNGALSVATNLDKYLGWLELVLAINGAAGSVGFSSPVATAAPNAPVLASAGADMWALLEARAAYVPASEQTFKLNGLFDQY